MRRQSDLRSNQIGSDWNLLLPGSRLLGPNLLDWSYLAPAEHFPKNLAASSVGVHVEERCTFCG